jgi:predicted secreted protein
MNLVSGTVFFVCIWWIFFYMMLPWQVKKQETIPEGCDYGAPQHHHLKKKILITTLLACLVFGVVFYLAERHSGFFAHFFGIKDVYQ